MSNILQFWEKFICNTICITFPDRGFPDRGPGRGFPGRDSDLGASLGHAL